MENYTIEKDNWEHELTILRNLNEWGLEAIPTSFSTGNNLYDYFALRSRRSFQDRELKVSFDIAVYKYKTLTDYLLFRKRGTGRKITAFYGNVYEWFKTNYGTTIINPDGKIERYPRWDSKRIKEVSIDEFLDSDEFKGQRDIFINYVPHLFDPKYWSKEILKKSLRSSKVKKKEDFAALEDLLESVRAENSRIKGQKLLEGHLKTEALLNYINSKLDYGEKQYAEKHLDTYPDCKKELGIIAECERYLNVVKKAREVC